MVLQYTASYQNAKQVTTVKIVGVQNGINGINSSSKTDWLRYLFYSLLRSMTHRSTSHYHVSLEYWNRCEGERSRFRSSQSRWRPHLVVDIRFSFLKSEEFLYFFRSIEFGVHSLVVFIVIGRYTKDVQIGFIKSFRNSIGFLFNLVRSLGPLLSEWRY